MAIDVQTFKAAFPEFIDAPNSLVQSQLDYAVTRVPEAVWSAALKEEGTFLYCAQFLALSPYARNMGLVNDKGVTNYDERLYHLKLTVTSGFRVTL